MIWGGRKLKRTYKKRVMRWQSKFILDAEVGSERGMLGAPRCHTLYHTRHTLTHMPAGSNRYLTRPLSGRFTAVSPSPPGKTSISAQSRGLARARPALPGGAVGSTRSADGPH